jgi:hypothetical protein
MSLALNDLSMEVKILVKELNILSSTEIWTRASCPSLFCSP